MSPRDFLSELQRRNVYKVGVAYGVVAWLLIQIATQIFPFFEIPSWIVRALVLLLVLGFPVAVVLAWLYELTPEGVKRTDEVPREESIAHKTGRRLLLLSGVVVVLGLALLLFRFVHSSSTAHADSKEATTAIPDKSIAVLPFVNLSANQENAFFADGVQDEILTALARIADLKVISHASVMQFRELGKRNLQDIARELGVAHVLEGSVQRTANRVRVTAQLIDARTNAQIWADRYDGDLADVFGIQTEIAQKIASQLNAVLSPREREYLAQKPTSNPQAYDSYLRAREFWRASLYDQSRAQTYYSKARGYESNPDRLLEDFRLAERFYREAIQHDPSFALAYAGLAASLAKIYHWFDPTEKRKAEIKQTAEKAAELKPDLGEAHFALGLYFYWVEREYEKANEQLRIAATALPNDGDVQYVTAAIRRRQGRWKENLALLDKAQTVDPRNANVAWEIAITYSFTHDWPQAARMYDHILTLLPNSSNFRINRAYMDFYSDARTDTLKQILAEIPDRPDPSAVVTRARWDLAMLEREYAAADRIMAAYPLDVFQADGMSMPKSFFLGCTALARGDASAAQAQFTAALPAFESAVQEAPANGLRHANLGLLYSFMGRKEDAIRQALRAVDLEPESKDALGGPWMKGFLALIYARTGELDSALPLLDRLLRAPFPVDNTNCCITYSDLRKRWQWDPVRNDPRFQQLLTKR